MICDRSRDATRDQDVQRCMQAVAVSPARRRELETLVRERWPQLNGQRLTVATRAFHWQETNSGHGSELAGTGKPLILFPGGRFGFKPRDRALAFQPRHARLTS